jgi:hypothetical protein
MTIHPPIDLSTVPNPVDLVDLPSLDSFTPDQWYLLRA